MVCDPGRLVSVRCYFVGCRESPVHAVRRQLAVYRIRSAFVTEVPVLLKYTLSVIMNNDTRITHV